MAFGRKQLRVKALVLLRRKWELDKHLAVSLNAHKLGVISFEQSIDEAYMLTDQGQTRKKIWIFLKIKYYIRPPYFLK